MDLSGSLGGVFQDYLALHVSARWPSRMGWRRMGQSITGLPGYSLADRPCRRAWSRSLAAAGADRASFPDWATPRVRGQ
jgi:hypothetical protein